MSNQIASNTAGSNKQQKIDSQLAMQHRKAGNQSPQNASLTKGKSPFVNGSKQPNSPTENSTKAPN